MWNVWHWANQSSKAWEDLDMFHFQKFRIANLSSVLAMEKCSFRISEYVWCQWLDHQLMLDRSIPSARQPLPHPARPTQLTTRDVGLVSCFAWSEVAWVWHHQKNWCPLGFAKITYIRKRMYIYIQWVTITSYSYQHHNGRVRLVAEFQFMTSNIALLMNISLKIGPMISQVKRAHASIAVADFCPSLHGAFRALWRCPSPYCTIDSFPFRLANSEAPQERPSPSGPKVKFVEQSGWPSTLLQAHHSSSELQMPCNVSCKAGPLPFHYLQKFLWTQL